MWNMKEIRPIKKQPWYSSYQCAKARCRNPNYPHYKNYGGRGIEFRLTPFEFHFMWMRDSALLMKRPSIDRINNDGHYERKNCRFIELSENSRRSAIGRKRSKESIEKMIKTNTGRKRSKEFCEKMRRIHLGTKRKPLSFEHKTKICIGVRKAAERRKNETCSCV